MAEHICDSAKRLFAQRGYAGVAINDIVAAAEVSKPTLYYYFPDKEHLYLEVLRQIIEGSGSYCNQVLLQEGLSLQEKLIQLAEGFIEHSPTSLPCLMRDVAQYLSEPIGQQIVALYNERMHQPFEKIFAEAVEAGEICNQPPRVMSELFLTLLDWLSLRFTFHETASLSPREKATQVVNLFWEGVRNRSVPTP